MRQLRELPRAPQCPKTSSQTTGAIVASQGQPAATQISHTQDDSAQNNTTPALEPAGQQQQLAEQLGEPASSHKTSKDEAHNTAVEQNKGTENQSSEDVDMEAHASTDARQDTDRKEAPAATSDPPPKRPLSPSKVEHFLFKCLLNVIPEESDVLIEMHWVEGQNKDLMNQLCTYLKNILLKSVTKS